VVASRPASTSAAPRRSSPASSKSKDAVGSSYNGGLPGPGGPPSP
jgi:hypothetical protein